MCATWTKYFGNLYHMNDGIFLLLAICAYFYEDGLPLIWKVCGNRRSICRGGRFNSRSTVYLDHGKENNNCLPSLGLEIWIQTSFHKILFICTVKKEKKRKQWFTWVPLPPALKGMFNDRKGMIHSLVIRSSMRSVFIQFSCVPLYCYTRTYIK